ncbi:MAG: protein translocase subunit SecF [Acidimicrobiales bacterium]|nr:protein translocase subunit SecF [Acidimicrobiales bacterium]
MTTVDETLDSDLETDEVEAPDEKRRSALGRLYHGETKYDFVGRMKIWMALSGTVILIGLISLTFRGLNFGIDFRGGTSWSFIAPNVSPQQVHNVMNKLGYSGATVEKLGGKTIQVQDRITGTTTAKETAAKDKITAGLASLAHVDVNGISVDDVGPTWGGYITTKALQALVVFFILTTLYITIRFEWKMAVGALAALVHDILVTVGIYSLSGFQVTPDTVVAFLTILGYSLYDTMVVFDRVHDNVSREGARGRMTYSSIVNLSMNQVLARSINTSLVAIMPILAVLLIGAQLLGATTLQYFGLALFIGLTTGAYSSIFIASPIVAALKEKEPRHKTIRARLEARGEANFNFSPDYVAKLSRSTSATDAPPTQAPKPKVNAKQIKSTVKIPSGSLIKPSGGSPISEDSAPNVGVKVEDSVEEQDIEIEVSKSQSSVKTAKNNQGKAQKNTKSGKKR